MYWRPPTARPPGRGYTVLPTTWKARALLAIAFFGGLVALPGCVVFTLWGMANADSISITYENRTARQVTIMVNGQYEVTVPANTTLDVAAFRPTWTKSVYLKAVLPSGRVILSRRYEPDELKRLQYRVVIEEPPP